MQLDHTFTVPVPVDEAWTLLLDIERIAPCMPGAAIDSVEGDDFTGTVKVRIGPIGLVYKGRARFTEKDVAARRAVINARGREARGNGTAMAKLTATLTDVGDHTKVDVRTDLNITGRPTQFGRGVMADVGNKLIGQFADCLAARLTSDEAVPVVAAPEPAGGPPADAAPVHPPAAAANPPAAPDTPAGRLSPGASKPSGLSGFDARA